MPLDTVQSLVGPWVVGDNLRYAVGADKHLQVLTTTPEPVLGVYEHLLRRRSEILRFAQDDKSGALQPAIRLWTALSVKRIVGIRPNLVIDPGLATGTQSIIGCPLG